MVVRVNNNVKNKSELLKAIRSYIDNDKSRYIWMSDDELRDKLPRFSLESAMEEARREKNDLCITVFKMVGVVWRDGKEYNESKCLTIE